MQAARIKMKLIKKSMVGENPNFPFSCPASQSALLTVKMMLTTRPKNVDISLNSPPPEPVQEC